MKSAHLVLLAWVGAFVLLWGVVGASAQTVSPTPPKELEQTREIGPFLGRCVSRAMMGQRHIGNREVTFSMSFRKDGSLIGIPQRTYSFPPAAGVEQQQFIAAVDEAIIKCAPLPFSKGLGEAIAGRRFNYRHIIKPRQDIRA
ncbi:MAG: hypothetical protein ACRCWF_17265 [Beijerinckiaceae bacterium]